nr:tumor necrosis factor receptor superfamily member 5 isoform X2 [Misgurnus anguillicaudatus]
MRIFYTLCIVVTLFYLVWSCEKETHYEKDGKCCKKCGPGKRMLMNDDCMDPSCQDCSEGEYQNTYTSETKCKPQPSCDTNLNFLPQITPTPKDKLSVCKCKPGYFCTTDDDCSVCRPHKVCSAGQKIHKAGSPVSDTACENCQIGTFSVNNSATTCEKWTTCDSGYVEKTPGTSTSDRICEKGTPSDRAAILGAVFGVLLLIVTGIAIMLFLKKRKINLTWNKLKRTQLKEDPSVAEPFNAQQPEEDVETPEPVSPTPSNVTENGNVVVQEDGKHSIVSSTETRPFSENSYL